LAIAVGLVTGQVGGQHPELVAATGQAALAGGGRDPAAAIEAALIDQSAATILAAQD
jgi:hypothetical protein